MSQADAAPITGTYDFAPVKSAGIIGAVSPSATDSKDSFATGSSPSTRRSVIAGFLLAPMAMAAPAAIAGGTFAPPPIADEASSPDAGFWEIHARWQAIDRQWQSAFNSADGDDAKEATFDDWAEFEHQARVAVLLAPIRKPAALLAKLQMVDAAVDLDTGDDTYPDFWACLVRDVEGLTS